ncbi:hypothetical protein [Nitratireductor luteus]|uniref:hypothetical protein n=1 Tax=Nitratireductor luteus TaxID=2976980 RepID=UPI0022409DB6|nr:hypothetical protein [Nitratireductor luteus]
MDSLRSRPIPDSLQGDSFWLATMRRYLLAILGGNLVWETLHLPLYTIWTEGTAGELIFAVVHCTGGDLLIALSSLILALIFVGDAGWPARKYRSVAVLAISFGLGYTIFSEWLNTAVRESWAYSDLMPVVFGTGVSPVVQWVAIPLAGFWWARRPMRIDGRPETHSLPTVTRRSKTHA